MRDLKIYNSESGNLMSIKPIENILPDRNYMLFIITNLWASTNGCFYIEVSRPNYDNNLIEQLKAGLTNTDNIKYTDFEIILFSDRINKKILDVLPEIWFAYEHSTFCFFSEDQINFDIRRKPWYEITSKSKSYVMFRGIEEDVIWIGKNNLLEFALK